MVADLLRKQVYRPEALRLLLADALGRRHPVLSTSRHLDEEIGRASCRERVCYVV